VVGGGLAGLAAATYAARCGARVVVFEATGRAGGRARTDHRDGVSFNQGPHALYERGQGMEVLHELGIDPPGGRPSVSGRAVWCDNEGRLPFDFLSLATTRLLSPGARLAFARFHTRLGRLDARSFDSISVSDFLDGELGAERADLRALVEGIVRLSLYADAPELHSAGAAIDQLVLATSGVRYLHRGWGSLVSSLESAAHALGVTLHSGVSVERVVASVDPGANMWAVVDGHGRRWPASSVICAGLGPEAAERLTGCESARLRNAAGPAVRVACLDLVLAASPTVTFALDLDNHAYYSVHAPVADLTTDGRALVSLARYRRPEEILDAGRDRAILRAFARRMGVETTLAERYLHDMTVTHGMPLAGRGGLDGRPRVDALGRDGLLLAGDWVGPTGLLADAALASGREAGQLAARIAQVRRAA
jgi:phytoene dehydrogenase-like protein